MGFLSVSMFLCSKVPFPMQTVPGQAEQAAAAPCCGWVQLNAACSMPGLWAAPRAAPGAGPSSDSSPEIHISVLTPLTSRFAVWGSALVCGRGQNSLSLPAVRNTCPSHSLMPQQQHLSFFNPCSSSELVLHSFTDLVVSSTQGAAVRA